MTLAQTLHISERVLALLEKEPSCGGGETTCSCQFLERSGGREEGRVGAGEALDAVTALITAGGCDEEVLFSD